MRWVQRRRKSTQRPQHKRSVTRRGYVFETTVSASTRRIDWQPLLTWWRARGGVVSSVLLLSVVAWLSFTFFISDDFYVYGAAVEGNLAVPAGEIFAASELDGVSVFWIHPQRTAQAVMRLPDIKMAQVSCRLPAQVTIRVVERQARVVWQWQTQSFWVDENGVVLTPRGELPEALIVQDASAAPPLLGGRVDAQAVVAAQQLHALRPQLSTVGYQPDRGLVLTSEGGWPVYLGVGNDVAAKLAILAALEADLQRQGIRPAYIDLRYPERPTYR